MVLVNVFLLVECPVTDIGSKENTDECKFGAIRTKIDRIFEDLLKDVDKSIRSDCGDEKIEHDNFESYLMAHYVSKVVSYGGQFCENCVNWPLSHQILPVNALSNYRVTSFPILLKLRSKGENVKSYFL